MDDDAPRYLYADEVAAMLRVSTRTVIRAIERGEIEGMKFGRRWLIPKSEPARVASGVRVAA